MMQPIKVVSGASLLALGVVLSACAQQGAENVADIEPVIASASESKSVELAPMISTVKPGASVTFSETVTQDLDIGDSGFAMLTINEGYPSGLLTLTATGDHGVSIPGGASSTQLNMADGTRHSWRIDFSAETEGVHYLNIVAEAAPSDGLVQSRAYAIRIEVGDWKTVQAEQDAAKPMEMQADGEMAVLMQAEETIE